MIIHSKIADAFLIWGTDRRGIAALEFAIAAPVLIIMIMNLYDFSAYTYQAMQVANAAAAGAEAAWKVCPPAQQPATKGSNCPGLTAAVQAAVASTSLQANVSLVPGSPTEGYYCVNASTGALQLAGGVNSNPPACGAGTIGTAPGDYITVQVSYSYAPLFSLSSFSVASVLPTPITSSSTFRLN